MCRRKLTHLRRSKPIRRRRDSKDTTGLGGFGVVDTKDIVSVIAL